MTRDGVQNITQESVQIIEQDYKTGLRHRKRAFVSRRGRLQRRRGDRPGDRRLEQQHRKRAARQR